MNPLLHKRAEIDQICRKHHVQQLFAFGSVLGPDYNPSSSDVDFVVIFLPVPLDAYFDNFLSLLEALENTLSSKVDLVEYKAIRNPVFKRVVDREKQLFYD